MERGKEPIMKSGLGRKSVVSLVFLLICGSVYGQPWPGSGDANDPYQIHSAAQMNAIGADANYWDAHFLLCADIDLSAYAGTSFNIIGNDVNAFRGSFDGNSHTISNFTYECDATHRIGLFGRIDGLDAEVRDLGLITPDVNAGSGGSVGALVGRLFGGTVTGCYVEGGRVSGGYGIGGLAGFSHDGEILDCYSTGNVVGENCVGGLTGYNDSGDIQGCYSTCEVTGGMDSIGGLVGYNDGEIQRCYSEGSIEGQYRVGGLVGENRSDNDSISECYSAGDVTGGNYVGGLVGMAGPDIAIVNCYSAGSVTGSGDDVGGLVGFGRDAKNSYWDVNSSGMSVSDGGVGLTTEQMQSKGTYLFWGCEQVWTIDDGSDYPRLMWEGKLGEVIDFGCGTAEEPYLIYDGVQMHIIGDGMWNWDKHYKLMADIDLGAYTGTSFNLIGYYLGAYNNGFFTGVFDGNGHTISNFTYDSDGVGRIGLFGWVDDPNAEIKNLGLIKPDVNAGDGGYVGCLIGYLEDGTVTNCYVEGGRVKGGTSVGGLIGRNFGFNVMNCYSTCSVTGDRGVGGLAGSGSGDISNSYSSSSVTGNEDVGGLVGFSTFDISNSYSAGSVTGGERVGGLIGHNRSVVFNCYSMGGVLGDADIGGLIGYDSSGDYTACFWDVNVNPDVNGIGNTADPNVIGESTANMQTESTFTDAGWDFVGEVINGTEDIWQMCALPDYPKLWWEICPIVLEMNFVPEMLNCESKGDWVEAHFVLPEGYLPEDVDVNVPAVAEPIGAVSDYIEIVDEGEGNYGVVAVFDREGFCEALGGDAEKELEVTVEGAFMDGVEFYGTDTIKLRSDKWRHRRVKRLR